MSLGRDKRQNFPLQLDLANRRGGEAARPEREASETRQAVNASERRLDPAHRKPLPPPRRPSTDGEPIVIRRAGDHVARRSLDPSAATSPARGGSMTAHAEIIPSVERTGHLQWHAP